MTADHDQIETTQTERALRALHADDSEWALEAGDLDRLAAFSEIVVPLAAERDSSRGLYVAARLAERWDVPIRLISVDPTGPAGSVTIAAGGRLEGARAALMARHPALEVSDVLLGAVDEPVAALHDALTAGDLVVLATDAAGTGTRPSFAEALADRWGGPLLLIGPEADIDLDIEPGAEIIVGVDGSALAERALPLALAMAHRFELRPLLMQVVSTDHAAQLDRLRSRGEAVSDSAYLRDVAERLGAGWEIVHDDDPVAALVRVTAERRVPLVVLSTHGATGLARQVFGSVAMGVVHGARCPVLVRSGYRSRPLALPGTTAARRPRD
ncbi:MAG: universal stress protein [Acidimicrobiales bacterium]